MREPSTPGSVCVGRAPEPPAVPSLRAEGRGSVTWDASGVMPQIMLDLCAEAGDFFMPFRVGEDVYAMDVSVIARVHVSHAGPAAGLLPTPERIQGFDVGSRIQRAGPFDPHPVDYADSLRDGSPQVLLAKGLFVARRPLAALAAHGARIYPPTDARVARPGPAPWFRFTCGPVTGFLVTVGKLGRPLSRG